MMAHRMASRFLVCAIFFLTAGFSRAEVPTPIPPLPTIPQSGIKILDFVPKDWAILFQAEGDLNRDGRPDAALILKFGEEDADRFQAVEIPRLLVFLLQAPSGGYRLSASTSKLVLCRACGGIYGDPVQDFNIERGAVVVSHYGGSRYRWGFTHRYRLQDGDWVLIGSTSVTNDNLTQEIHQKDTNLLTGEVIQEDTDRDGKVRTKRYRGPKRPLKKISHVDVIKD